MPALDESDFTIVDRQGNDAGFGSLASTGLGYNAHEHFAKRKALRASSHTLTDCVLLYEEVNTREDAIAEAERCRAALDVALRSSKEVIDSTSKPPANATKADSMRLALTVAADVLVMDSKEQYQLAFAEWEAAPSKPAATASDDGARGGACVKACEFDLSTWYLVHERMLQASRSKLELARARLERVKARSQEQAAAASGSAAAPKTIAAAASNDGASGGVLLPSKPTLMGAALAHARAMKSRRELEHELCLAAPES